ncbi:MAG: hypothetical protein RLY11_1325 [Bacteroidota bacterium]|jgi:acyl transferase domain-containing protein
MANSRNVFAFLKEVLPIYRVILTCTKIELIDSFIACINNAKETFSQDQFSVRVLNVFLEEVMPVLNMVKANYCHTVLPPVKAEECSVYVRPSMLTSLPPAISDDDDDEATIEEDFDDEADVQTIKIQIQLAEVSDADDFDFDFDFEDQ